MAERPLPRRSFLKGAATLAVGSPLAGILAACARAVGGDPDAAGGIPVPTRGSPVSWGVDEDLALPSGLGVERGATLRVYQWREYLYGDVLDAFVRRHAADGIGVEVESFSDMDEALARLRADDADFDLFFPTINVLGGLVGARLLRPLNHDYLPNIRNLWPEFRSPDGPFYDVGARYTVPYTVYSSGIAWRTDLVDPADAREPFDLPWNPRYRRRSGFLDQYREALALALVRDGAADVNTTNRDALERAALALAEAVRGGAAITGTGAYEDLPQARLVAHQSWSGDVLTALTYGGRDPAETGRTLSYWWPAGGSGWVGCDLTAVCARGRNPVLAHAFVDHLLDSRVAFENFVWNGYQPPLDTITRERAVAGYPGLGAMGADGERAILTPDEFARAQMFHALDPSSDAAWLDAWQTVIAAA